ncbi:MAG TPA: hypothetical protein VNV36_06150 [Pseudomonas sp.]|uniref:hypothetical protein n=1 Tax=Pseudomonas sp. TaxID=306 RepID=UPI002BDA783E|nr:hypothetical protein [Pseudomonas sp.]HWH86337.1 hypothetical protein [Pseudomonas sp.]
MKTKPTALALTSPRAYACAILKAPDEQRRQMLLQACPEHWRALVASHLATAALTAKPIKKPAPSRPASKPPVTVDYIPPPPRSTARAVGREYLSQLHAAIGTRSSVRE